MAHVLTIEIVICTHNRAKLLARTLDYLNKAERPRSCNVSLFVVANACTDGTMNFLGAYAEEAPRKNGLSLRWLEEQKPGKSHALNRAIPRVSGDIIAFVDDDHRISTSYFRAIDDAARRYPDATLFCGRIIPDWDGQEPAWAHDSGLYAIYPLPIPRYDRGKAPMLIGLGGPFPGGGNLVLRRSVFDRVGKFSTELGPRGHDLSGGEDSDFVLRALQMGERLQYVPDIIQYHYVDLERLRLGYLLRKSFQRSRSVTKVRRNGAARMPLYLWRKLMTYLWHTATSLYWPETRFYLVRSAATLGEISAYMASHSASSQ